MTKNNNPVGFVYDCCGGWYDDGTQCVFRSSMISEWMNDELKIAHNIDWQTPRQVTLYGTMETTRYILRYVFAPFRER